MELFQIFTIMKDISRFLKAQEGRFDNYQTALQEIRNGRKVSHWIWYIFPQVSGLGFSEMSVYYGIDSVDEARAYLENQALRNRLYEITRALLEHSDKAADSVLGHIDAMKVRSSMTLFDVLLPNDVFAEVLDKFYGGKRCDKTLDIISRQYHP